MEKNKIQFETLVPISFLLILLVSLVIVGGNSLDGGEQKNYFTEIHVQNMSDKDSVKGFLTLQAPNSVVGYFGIKEADTMGSCSQGFFFAHKDSIYKLISDNELYGLNISFEAPPMNCSEAIAQGFDHGINIFEGSINCTYESFDISCIDGINSILEVSVSDSNWRTGMAKDEKIFHKVSNSIHLQDNFNKRGVYPYRCTDCIYINSRNIPENCFNLPDSCNTNHSCQVNRYNSIGGVIFLKYLGDGME